MEGLEPWTNQPCQYVARQNGLIKKSGCCTTRIYRSYAKVVVKTTLNQKTTDESFAIDNVVFDIAKANMFHTRRDRVANQKVRGQNSLCRFQYVCRRL